MFDLAWAGGGQTGTSHYKFFRVSRCEDNEARPGIGCASATAGDVCEVARRSIRVVAAYRGERLPAEVGSMTPGQLEAVCFEYLRSKEPSMKLMLPLGRTLPDVDYLG